MLLQSAVVFLLLSEVAAHLQRDYSYEYEGGRFCKAPKIDKPDFEPDWTCNRQEDPWEDTYEPKRTALGFKFHKESYTGECGPDCRPSCVTLMLDLEKLNYEEKGGDITCKEDELCMCSHTKNNKVDCSSHDYDHMFQEYPSCYLEEAHCLGATVYDDFTALNNKKVQQLAREAGNEVGQQILRDWPRLEHCTTIPDQDLYCRFQDFKLVTPMELVCGQKDPCFDKDTKIFFEYCNIVEEDPKCDSCNSKKCGKRCPKTIEPFPPGWTSFTVSASIPYIQGSNPTCDKQLKFEHETEKACFMQRIDIYYPPKNDECSDSCPVCHDCPLLHLGDKFGPLEVVGFGHHIDQPCVACDKQTSRGCLRDYDFRCNALEECDRTEDCHLRGRNPLGYSDFGDGQCSFAGQVVEDSASDLFADEFNYPESGSGGSDNEEVGDRGPIFAGATGGDTAIPDDGVKVPPIVVPIALIAVISFMIFAVVRRRRRAASVSEPKVDVVKSNNGEWENVEITASRKSKTTDK